MNYKQWGELGMAFWAYPSFILGHLSSFRVEKLRSKKRTNFHVTAMNNNHGYALRDTLSIEVTLQQAEAKCVTLRLLNPNKSDAFR